MQNHFGLLDADVMPICITIALDIFIIIHFSINCSTVICSPTVILPILREASSEHNGPQVCSTLYFQPYIFYFVALSAFRSHFAINLEGIDNPFIALGASLFVFVQVLWTLGLILLLDWHLGSQNWGKYLLLLCCITLSTSREKPTQAQEAA